MRMLSNIWDRMTRHDHRKSRQHTEVGCHAHCKVRGLKEECDYRQQSTNRTAVDTTGKEEGSGGARGGGVFRGGKARGGM